MAPCRAVAPQLVGHDHPRCVLQTLQKSPEEALGRVAIAPILNKNVEDNAMLIDGTLTRHVAFQTGRSPSIVTRCMNRRSPS